MVRRTEPPGPPDDDIDDVERILRSTTLSREEQIRRLRELSYDARELDVATEEGMADPGPDRARLARIQAALRALHAGDAGTDAKH